MGIVQDVLTRARYLLQDQGIGPGGDVDPELYRWTDAELIVWLNDAMSVAVKIAPSLFTKTGAHTCTAGHYQTLSLARATELTGVIGLLVADEIAMTQFNPGWKAAAPTGAAANWFRTNDPRSFMLTPPSMAGQLLDVMYIQSHATVYGALDVVDLPDIYIPALADYVVAWAEAKDDESVSTERHLAFVQNFTGKIKDEA